MKLLMDYNGRLYQFINTRKIIKIEIYYNYYLLCKAIVIDG